MEECFPGHMEFQDCHDPLLKELPTREQKLRRNKDRRDCPTLPPIRLRLKGCHSPLHDTEMDRSLSDRSVSSSPESMNLHFSPTSAFSCYSKYSSRAASLASPPAFITEASNSSNHYSDEEASGSVVDTEQPLDMSTKRCHETLNNRAHSVDIQQQQRPSVITCASALLRTQCNLADVTHHICNFGVADTTAGEDSHAVNSDSDSNKSDCSNHEVLRPGHRREIVSGSCDPVIDEHFRRSLGKDYQQIFSKSSANSVSITVDDHFAKALGDTWLQLQQSSKTVGTDNSQQPAKGIHSKPFLQHSPEIVST